MGQEQESKLGDWIICQGKFFVKNFYSINLKTIYLIFSKLKINLKILSYKKIAPSGADYILNMLVSVPKINATFQH